MIATQTFRDSFLNVMELYSTLRGSVWGVPKWSVTGKVKAEPIDFIADVEVKLKRALQRLPHYKDTANYYEQLLSLVELGEYTQFPFDLQVKLGELFKSTGLDAGGDYRMLYYRAKNNRLLDREAPSHFPEEIFSAEDLLSE
jgi:hypothetical protein